MRRAIIATVGLFLLLGGAPAAMGDEHEQGAEWHWFGTLRMRPEYSENLSDVSAGRDDKIAYAGYRANIGASVKLDMDVKLVFDGQIVGLWGENQSPFGDGLTTDNTDADFSLFRAFAEAKDIFGTGFDLRAGRQRLVFGDEWLLGDLDFYGGTSFDGLRGDFDHDNASTSLFWGKLAETNTPEAVATTEDSGGDANLYGLWYNRECGSSHEFDVSVIYLHDHREEMLESIVTPMTFLDVPFRDKRWTMALGYGWGEETGGFVRANAAMQWGSDLIADVGDVVTQVDIDAEAYELTGGYVWERDGNPYKVWARLGDYSGDDAETSDDETFNPLFQDFHGRHGYLDFWNGIWGFREYVGGSPGFRVLQVGGTAEIPSGVRLTFLAQTMHRNERLPSSPEPNEQLGEEYGITAAYDYGDNVTLELGVAQLYPGASLKLEPPLFGTSTTRRVYINSLVKF